MIFKSQKEIYQALLDGKKIRHFLWVNSYICLDDCGIVVDESNSVFHPSLARPSDWRIYEEPKPKKVIKLVEYVWTGDPEFFQAQLLWRVEKPYTITENCWKPTGKTRDVEVEE